jgi:hypothetical protein
MPARYFRPLEAGHGGICGRASRSRRLEDGINAPRIPHTDAPTDYRNISAIKIRNFGFRFAIFDRASIDFIPDTSKAKLKAGFDFLTTTD